jgi:hypothetical protein
MLYQLSHVRIATCQSSLTLRIRMTCVQNCSRSWPASKLGPDCREAKTHKPEPGPAEAEGERWVPPRAATRLSSVPSRVRAYRISWPWRVPVMSPASRMAIRCLEVPPGLSPWSAASA